MRKLSGPRRFWGTATIIVTIALSLIGLGSGALRSLDRAAEAAGGGQPQTGRKAAAGAKASPAASAALERLRRASGAQIKAHVAPETSHFDFVRATGRGVLAAGGHGSPEERATAFLREHGALVGMSDAERQSLGGGGGQAVSSLKTDSVVEDSNGGRHVRLSQTYRGLPVFGAQLVVHMNDRGVTAVNGHFVPGLRFDTRPAVKQAAAEATALREQLGDAPLSVTKTELSVYREGLLEGFEGRNVLAYNVEVTDGGATRAQVWIDAQKGTVLKSISLNHKALDRVIYTPIYNPAAVVRREGDPYTPGATPGTTGADPINNLYLFAGETYNLWKSAFDRDSYDGAGHTMHSVYLVNQVCPNAYWNSVSTNYCPDFDADDVVSHEWGHAYTEHTHGLIYAYQSGALNESYSDIFGESHDLLNGVDAEGGANNEQPTEYDTSTGQYVPVGGGVRWRMGEDVQGFNQPAALGILRDMWNPRAFADPDKVSAAEYACGSGDGGGVHTNSGVPNHAFAMLVDGKTYNGVTVQGIGFNRALAIYYRAMTFYQTPTTNFAQHADALEQSCDDLLNTTVNAVSTSSPNGASSGETIDAATCQQVANAMLAVEMRDPVPCPFQPVLDPETPAACAGSLDIFREDWETGDDGWTRTSAGTFPEWEDDSRSIRDFKLTSTLPAGRASTAAFAEAPGIGAPGGGGCTPAVDDYSGQFSIDSPNITIPAGADDVKLSFEHYVATETGVDGGQVELSVNGGLFQLVPNENYVHNAPNASYNQPPPVDNNTNPNPGEAAWTGTNVNGAPGDPPGSWGTTIIDLSALTNPGDTVRVRFNWSQDGCNGVDGWYIDNVRVYSCPVLDAPVLSLGADYQEPDPDGAYTLTWTRPAGATGPDTLQQSSSSCAPLLSDDAEGGLGQWVVTTTGTATPGLAWEAVTDDKPQHTGTTFRARGANAVPNASSLLTYNGLINVPAAGPTSLSFSDWNVNEGDDGVFVEVSTDGASWTAIYQDVRSELAPDGAAAFATEPLFSRRVDLSAYAGQSIHLRFRYQMGAEDRAGSAPLGWYLDDIAITNDNWSDVVATSATSHTVTGLSNGTRCYRVRTTFSLGGQTFSGPFSNVVSATVSRTISETSDIEDDDPRISYANGWHLAQSAGASAGHFRVTPGKGSQGGASLAFEVPSGQTGKITYHYARSTKGGTADIYLDGAYKETVTYRGSVGKLNDPEFNGYQVSYGGLGAGRHVLEIRTPRDAVYIDRFTLESAGSNAQPKAGPGQTSGGTATIAPGTQSLLSVALPAGTQAISVVAASSPELPIQLVLLDPSGLALSTANSSSGVAVISKNVTQPGVYVIKVVNVGLGPVEVWTAATPLVTR